MTIIVDSGGANLNSIIFSLKRFGATVKVSKDAAEIRAAERVILPGVGTASVAMQRLRDLQLVDTLQTLTQPVLGICLGMQLLYDFSEEGQVGCLGIIPGKVTRIPQSNLIIPHMGWNTVQLLNGSPITNDIGDQQHFYFIHSYCAPVNEFSVGITQYGNQFTVIAQKNNFYAAQFHPERSSHVGSQLMKNFLEL